MLKQNHGKPNREYAQDMQNMTENEEHYYYYM